MATTTISVEELEKTVERAMRNIGYPADEARTLTEIMMHAEVHNNNQGISKLYDVESPGGIKFNPDAGPLKVERESILAAVVNGNQRSGTQRCPKPSTAVARQKRVQAYHCTTTPPPQACLPTMLPS